MYIFKARLTLLHLHANVKCEHYFCPDDLLDCAWDQIRCMKYKISCKMCASKLDNHDILCFGLPEKNEMQCITEAISLNLCLYQDVQQCPRYNSYCQRKKTTNIKPIALFCSIPIHFSMANGNFCTLGYFNFTLLCIFG